MPLSSGDAAEGRVIFDGKVVVGFGAGMLDVASEDNREASDVESGSDWVWKSGVGMGVSTDCA